MTSTGEPRSAAVGAAAASTGVVGAPELGHAGVVRAALVIAIVAIVAVVALPAAAASIEPRSLVIAASAVPPGFRVDPKRTGVRTNERDIREVPAARAYFARWERLIGYQAAYRRGSERIESRSDVFRAARGARSMLAWIDLEARKAGIRGQRRDRLTIGSGGFVHSAGSAFTFVIWRQGRVFAGILAEGISRSRTIGLARAQERRIARELDRAGS